MPSGKLDGMRRVEDHRDAQCPHNRYGTEVDHEVIVSERGAPFRQKDAVIASRGHFIAHGAHIPRSHKLAFLDVDDAPRPRRRQEQVRLAA